MAFYAVCMLRMAVELGVQTDSQQSLYDDHAVIYLKHFCRIRKSLNDSVTGVYCLFRCTFQYFRTVHCF